MSFIIYDEIKADEKHGAEYVFIFNSLSTIYHAPSWQENPWKAKETNVEK